ncbi:DUF1353 domain-containing protein [Sulfurivirga sp.]|uniref:DUF1353 domain-containing protein n=1 Tax=Sulfurivirga sp. TaxID=2614236 RepID=UPI0025F79F35|nr:DUF1353 domain-containing protein [Sulfurivirga sp.]
MCECPHPLVVLFRPPPKYRFWRPARWTLAVPLHCRWTGRDGALRCADIPEGFDSDGTSTPWLLAWLIPRTGRAFPASILHDWLCEQGWNWAEAAHAWYQVARQCDVWWLRARLGWLGIRLWGVLRGYEGAWG